MSEKTYIGGIRVFPKKQNAPDFVIGNGTITISKFMQFCEENKNLLTQYKGEDQLRFNITRNKDNSFSITVDTWKPQN